MFTEPTTPLIIHTQPGVTLLLLLQNQDSTEQIEFLKDLVKAQRGDCKYLLVKDYKREGLTEESVAELQRMGLISIEHLLNTSEDGSDAKGDEVYVLQDELIIED